MSTNMVFVQARPTPLLDKTNRLDTGKMQKMVSNLKFRIKTVPNNNEN